MLKTMAFAVRKVPFIGNGDDLRECFFRMRIAAAAGAQYNTPRRSGCRMTGAQESLPDFAFRRSEGIGAAHAVQYGGTAVCPDV